MNIQSGFRYPVNGYQPNVSRGAVYPTDKIVLAFSGESQHETAPKPRKIGKFVKWLAYVTYSLGIGLGLSGMSIGGYRYHMNGSPVLWKADKTRWTETAAQKRSIDIQAETQRFLNNPNIRFRYFVQKPDSKDHQEVPANKEFLELREKVAARIVDLLKNRPDLLDQLQTQPFRISLYQATIIEKNEVGVCESNGTIGLAIPSLNAGLENPNDGHELVAHELTHRLDNMDEIGSIKYAFDGMLPGLTTQEEADFIEAREQEKKAIEENRSLLDRYALTNDEEFLAVLGEVYFEKPEELKKSNPTLFRIMDQFFQHGHNRVYSKKPSETFVFLVGGAGLFLFYVGGLVFICRRLREQSKEDSATGQ